MVSWTHRAGLATGAILEHPGRPAVADDPTVDFDDEEVAVAVTVDEVVVEAREPLERGNEVVPVGEAAGIRGVVHPGVVA